VTLIRGLLIVGLGLALLLGENTRTNIATFFGVYWILTGALAVRFALSSDRGRTPWIVLVAGIMALVTGFLVALRAPVEEAIGSGFAVHTVGVTALSVGLLRIGRAFRTEPLLHRRWGWDQLMFGAFEVMLGVSLLVGERGSHWWPIAIAIWSIGGGVILVLDAIALRRAGRDESAVV
jgi:uncharacterized membrane protein HdeD (DUF308 family)